METPGPPLTAETEALRAAYAALNRNDIPAMVEAFASDMEWIEPPDYTGGGTQRGRTQVEAHLSRARSTWAEGSCEPERFLVVGNKIVVPVNIRVRLKHESEWREGRHADVYTFRDGKAIQMRIFPDTQQALAWAGDQAGDI